MKRLCCNTFHGPPELADAECGRKEGHKGRHRDEWRQSDTWGNKRAKVVVRWDDGE